jgi:hypothetical protein
MHEFSRRHGDFAIAGALVAVQLEGIVAAAHRAPRR